MYKTIAFISFLGAMISHGSLLNAQSYAYDFNQVDSLQTIEQRNVVVFIHTEWCRYCKKMMHTTLVDDSVTTLLTENFYFVSLDAESKSEIHYQNNTFKFIPTGTNQGYNELVQHLALINGEINYPTICIINSQNEIVFQYPGYMKKAELIAVLNDLLNP